MFGSLIVLCLAINYAQDNVYGYTWNHNYNNNRNEYNERHRNRYYTNLDSNSNEYTPPQTHTQYKYRTVQTGSALIPHRGAVVHISPDLNQTKTYLAKIDTTILTTRRKHRKLITRPLKKSCIKCPPEKTVIAQKRLDGVLIEPPSAMSCLNHPYSRSLFEVETLFGPKYMFVLPQGNHNFIAKIINKRTTAVEQKCVLKYRVIVRQCTRYRSRNWDLRANCDLGSIWGSECTFTCKNGGLLTHNNPVVCGDDLTWTGDEPSCYTSNDYLNESENETSCELPLPPENGKFSCEINNIDPYYDNDLSSPNGSICRVNCNKYFEIPNHLQRYSIFHCENGRWNSTMMEFCHRRHKM